MNEKEYKILENVLIEGIESAKKANKKYEEFRAEKDWDVQDALISEADNLMSYAKGINKVLISIEYNHKDMKMLTEEINRKI